MSAKACTKCRVVKPIEDFHQDRTRPDGHMSRCAACCRTEARDRYRAAHPRTPTVPGRKTCARCQRAWPLDAFGHRSDSRDGHKSWCRPCEAERRRDLRTPREPGVQGGDRP
jgi:hypothetical protein